MATKITRTQGTNGGAPSAEVTPEEAAAIRAAISKKEQAPSTRAQAAVFGDWRKTADVLGSPFEVERIPVSKLRAMRRDAMLGFGLSFIKTPHVRAKWYINAQDNKGANAQIAAHLDHDLRRIYPSFVLQALNSLDFGFQAIAKRFEFRVPAGTYIEVDPNSGEQTEKPIWSQGGIQPIGWKPFVALPPETVNPLFNNLGEFDGIHVAPAQGAAATPTPGTGASTGGGKGGSDETTFDIDLYHSLWFTNEKDGNFGNIFGYPRLGYAYRYWWSYWFRWAIADRAFERKADPSVLVRHPDGEFVDPNTGETTSYAEYALLMGERMRSGGVFALPSEVYDAASGGASNVRMWDIEFTKDATNFDPFDESFQYIDIQKLRSLWIPEQSLIEGGGGTSSRNVAAEMGDSFTESQAVLSSQIVEHVNRWIIPQWLAVNYPEFVANGGTATLVMQGFADEDVSFTNQVIQLIGQQESGMKEVLKLVDLQKLLEARGTPIASFEEQQRREQQIAADAAAAQAPAVAPAAGQVGVVPTAGPTGFSNQYIQPREVIHFSAGASDFVENLPSSIHYQDREIRRVGRQLWDNFINLYKDEYETIISEFENSDEDLADMVELAVTDFVDRAKELLKDIPGSQLWSDTITKSKIAFGKIITRAANLELKRSKIKGKISDDDAEEWLRDHLAEFTVKAAETTRNEIRDFFAARMREGITDRKELARLAREHFDSFPEWKATRVVRTEIRDIYNAGTLLAAKSAGIELVQATDAEGGETDEECMKRDGKIFTVDEAFDVDEHPNGTLGWKLVPVRLSIERQDTDEGVVGRFDYETNTVILSNDATQEQETQYLKLVVDALIER